MFTVRLVVRALSFQFLFIGSWIQYFRHITHHPVTDDAYVTGAFKAPNGEARVREALACLISRDFRQYFDTADFWSPLIIRHILSRFCPDHGSALPVHALRRYSATIYSFDWPAPSSFHRRREVDY